MVLTIDQTASPLIAV